MLRQISRSTDREVGRPVGRQIGMSPLTLKKNTLEIAERITVSLFVDTFAIDERLS